MSKAKKSEEFLWNSVKKLKDSFYDNNCVTSVNSTYELQVFIRKATAIMAMGSFELRGCENSGDVSEGESTLVLGISWNKCKGTISINPTVVGMNKPNIGFT